MDVFVLATAFTSLGDLRERVRRWETVGAVGILVPDHLFAAKGGLLSADTRYPDPIPVLAAIGTMSAGLQLGTFVMNASLSHPVLIARHFAQLAALFGGERVVVGLGAGWNGEEFEALGIRMAPHPDRLHQFGETVRFTRSLLAGSAADALDATAGAGDVGAPWDLARRIRLPAAAAKPRILLGGGSDRFLRIAATAADWVDFNGSSRQLGIGRRQPSAADGVRRLTTTVTDLEESVRYLAAAAHGAGREPDEIRRSVYIDTIDFCPRDQVREREDRLRVMRGAWSAAVSQCPYVLIGPEGRMREALAEREARLGLSAIIVGDSQELERVIGLADTPGA